MTPPAELAIMHTMTTLLIAAFYALVLAFFAAAAYDIFDRATR